MNSPQVTQLIPIERVEKLIHLARGEKVLLDADLANHPLEKPRREIGFHVIPKDAGNPGKAKAKRK